RTSTAIENRQTEGLGRKSVLSGDVMYDAVMFYRDLARGSRILDRVGVASGEFGLVTVHRAENTRPEILIGLLETLDEIASRHWPLVFPMHPRTRHVLQGAASDWRPSDQLHIIEPVGYLDNLVLIENARMVLTDSGGLQKEAFFLGTPCVTLRSETEWPETVDGGGNRVVGTRREAVLEAIEAWGETRVSRENLAARASAAFGGGRASETIVESLASLFGRGGHA
ncbi:MAG: UDP-N-acetyl glucosamine 2-epimerase, partial [Gammaproteobacteria bacterium]